MEIKWQSAEGSRAAFFKKAPRFLCGPELRTRQTAEFYANDVEVAEALRDCDFGRWSGAQIDDLQQSEPEALEAWLADPACAPHGGESVAQLLERVAAWLTTLEATPGHVVAFTHPFVIRAALTHVLNCSAFNQIDVEPLSSIELRYNGRWRLRLPETVIEDAKR